MTYVLTPDFVSACNIDADIVPPPRTCASSFFNFSGNSTFYILVKDALKNTEGKTFLPCLSIALEVFKYLLVEILLSLSLYLPYSSLSLSLPTSMTRGLTFTAVGLTVLIALVLVHPTCCAITAHLWETRVFRRENDDVEEVEEERLQRVLLSF